MVTQNKLEYAHTFLPILVNSMYCCFLVHYATNRQVAGSIPDSVIAIYQWHIPAGRTMALGSTRPLIEMSTRCISWGKGGRCVRLATTPSFPAVVMKSRYLKCLEPSGPLQACNGTALPLTFFLLLGTQFQWKPPKLYPIQFRPSYLEL
jgi:hypothetical protein